MSGKHITPSQKNELSVLLRMKVRQKEIAQQLGKTIWRERKKEMQKSKSGEEEKTCLERKDSGKVQEDLKGEKIDHNL